MIIMHASTFPRTYKFTLSDLDDGDIRLSAITVEPNGSLTGPGKLTVKGAFVEKLTSFLSSQSKRDVMIAVYGDRNPTGEDPISVVYVFDIHPWEGKVSSINWDASQDGVLCVQATMPYSSLRVTNGGLLDQVAAQA